MSPRRTRTRAPIALLLLSLFAAPIANEALAETGAHACCPASEAASQAPTPCQYVAPLACCAQFGVPGHAAANAPNGPADSLAGVAIAPSTPIPPARCLAPERCVHGPPLAVSIRTTVLRL